MNAVRLELTFGTLTPKPTGATGGVKVRMIVPDHFYNTKTSPWRPLYVIACTIGSNVDVSTAGRATPAQYFDLNIPDFLWPNGTVNQYPYDWYVIYLPLALEFIRYAIIFSNTSCHLIMSFLLPMLPTGTPPPWESHAPTRTFCNPPSRAR